MAGYTFTKGINHLNGEQALCFARERHAFDDGDNQRGKNQMAVIRAIVDKASSPAILKGLKGMLILDAETDFVRPGVVVRLAGEKDYARLRI